jgi:sugar phosphate isomerase/epimerase
MLTLALSSWSFHRRLPYFGKGSWSPPQEGPEISILSLPEYSAALGITDLEICQVHLASTDLEYLADVGAALQAAGCRVVNVPIDVGNLAEPAVDQRNAEIAQILPWIDAANALGSPAVRINTGRSEGMNAGEALRIVAQGYARLAAYCGERGMTVLLENHGGLSATPEAIIELLALVDAANFRLCPDFGNFAPELREEGLRAMLPHAAMVHAKMMDFDEAGTHQAFDLDRCLNLVIESRYSGPLSIEFEGRGDPYEAVKHGRDYIAARVADVTTGA